VPPPPVFARRSDTGAVNTRRLNRQHLFEAVRRLGPISRADLAKRTRLSPPTVSALVDELVGGAGLLREIGTAASSGGRPPVLLEFNAEFGCLAGVDLTPDVIRFALADLQGRVIARKEAAPKTETRDQVVHQVLEGIDGIIRGAGYDPRSLFSVGLATSGAAWAAVPWSSLLQARFRAPVRIDTAAKMGAHGERWLGVARGVEDFVFVDLGADVGAGIVIGGRVYDGHRSGAGAIGRMTVTPRTDRKSPGDLGSCLNDSERDLPGLVGSAIGNIAAILDPGLVVIGGALPPDCAEFIGQVRTVVSRIVPNAPSIERSALGRDAQLLGAVGAAVELADAHLLSLAASPGGLRD
jgi:predicted NBD/HSP70 family sugar kinase